MHYGGYNAKFHVMGILTTIKTKAEDPEQPTPYHSPSGSGLPVHTTDRTMAPTLGGLSQIHRKPDPAGPSVVHPLTAPSTVPFLPSTASLDLRCSFQN